MPRASTTQSAKFFMEKLLKGLPALNTPETQIILKWDEIIGEELAQEVKIVTIQEGIILLKCLSAARKTELNFQKNSILLKSNQVLGRELIRGIRFI